MELSFGTGERLRITSRPDRLVIEVRGLLDAVVVNAVTAIVAAADAPPSVHVDLGGIRGHTDGGAAGLARLVRDNPAIAYRAGSEPGQLALLAIYAGAPQRSDPGA